MDRIGVVGTSWRQGGLAALSPFTIPVDERLARVPELARRIGVGELSYLATCNRVEVAFASDGRVAFAARFNCPSQLGSDAHTK